MPAMGHVVRPVVDPGAPDRNVVLVTYRPCMGDVVMVAGVGGRCR
jgi:hypothetical protein